MAFPSYLEPSKDPAASRSKRYIKTVRSPLQMVHLIASESQMYLRSKEAP